MKRVWSICLAVIVGAVASFAGEPLKVASLNPIVSDLVRQVGGDRVDVIDLMPAGVNPHTYYPTPAHLKEAASAALVVAAGKGMETYLDEFTESLGGNVRVFEVGKGVPSLKVTAGDVFVCCPAHMTGAIDPHWWHSIKNVRRASGLIADELSAIDPESRDHYQKGYEAYAERLDDLYASVKKDIRSIPRRDRALTTAHAAFGYFCREMGMRSITVQGLTSESNPNPSYLKDVIKTLRDEHVKAVFPEELASEKVLKAIAKETGVKIAGTLFADSLPVKNPTYEAMIRSNVDVIVSGLTGAK